VQRKAEDVGRGLFVVDELAIDPNPLRVDHRSRSIRTGPRMVNR
jgi:hypothetical protein